MQGLLKVSKVTDAVSGVADKIKSFLHFSVPDEGPLTDFQSWMPDFMSGLAEGIGDNESTVLDKVDNLASGISSLMQGATASVTTAASGAISNSIFQHDKCNLKIIFYRLGGENNGKL